MRLRDWVVPRRGWTPGRNSWKKQLALSVAWLVIAGVNVAHGRLLLGTAYLVLVALCGWYAVHAFRVHHRSQPEPLRPPGHGQPSRG